jgi:hypothetical protein
MLDDPLEVVDPPRLERFFARLFVDDVARRCVVDGRLQVSALVLATGAHRVPQHQAFVHLVSHHLAHPDLFIWA